MTDTQVKYKVKVGDAIKVVTEDHREVEALVTCVHGGEDGFMIGENWQGPAINAVYVSPDEEKRDPNGRQIERYSSLAHQNGTSANGRYYYK